DRQQAVDRRLNARLLGTTLHRTADMEGAHGQLRARFANRLRGDYADRLADINRRTACKIAAIATGTDAVARLASQHRTDDHRVDAGLVDALDLLFVDQFASRNDNRAVQGIDDVHGRAAAQDALGQRRNDIAALHH